MVNLHVDQTFHSAVTNAGYVEMEAGPFDIVIKVYDRDHAFVQAVIIDFYDAAIKGPKVSVS